MNTTPLLKNLDDAALQDAIDGFRAAAANWDGIGTLATTRTTKNTASRGIFRNLRLMDIGIAIKRNRIRQGTWSLGR